MYACYYIFYIVSFDIASPRRSRIIKDICKYRLLKYLSFLNMVSKTVGAILVNILFAIGLAFIMCAYGWTSSYFKKLIVNNKLLYR